MHIEISYKFVKEYNKNRNFLFFKMKDLNYYILNIKKCYPKYLLKEINLIEALIEDKLISDEFKDYLMNLLIYWKNEKYNKYLYIHFNFNYIILIILFLKMKQYLLEIIKK